MQAQTQPEPQPLADPAPPCAGLTVLYDGACPLCRREVAVYRGLQPLQPLQWRDVNQPLPALPAGTTPGQLLARFHVQQADGRLLSGAAAFVALWQALPGWRWLGRLGAWPGVTPLLEWGYRGFLRLRPWMQRVARAFEPLPMSRALVADLRSDHAGETGAVWIYRGILAVSRQPALREMARQHGQTEQRHLRQIEQVLPWPRRSRLLLPWRLAGFLTGALPALAGPRAVQATIAAVETFVDRHYQQQIDALAGQPQHAPLRALLQECQADERHHRDEAAAHLGGEPPRGLLRLWCAAVARGSDAAVHIARRV